jgi:hypothetical protein
MHPPPHPFHVQIIENKRMTQHSQAGLELPGSFGESAGSAALTPLHPAAIDSASGFEIDPEAGLRK